MVQSQRVRSADGGTYGNVGRGVLTGPGLADLDLSLFKNTALSEKANAAVPGGVLQPAQSLEFWRAQHDRIFERRSQRLGRTDHHNGDAGERDSIRLEAAVLTASKT